MSAPEVAKELRWYAERHQNDQELCLLLERAADMLSREDCPWDETDLADRPEEEGEEHE